MNVSVANVSEVQNLQNNLFHLNNRESDIVLVMKLPILHATPMKRDTQTHDPLIQVPPFRQPPSTHRSERKVDTRVVIMRT